MSKKAKILIKFIVYEATAIAFYCCYYFIKVDKSQKIMLLAPAGVLMIFGFVNLIKDIYKLNKNK